MKLGYVSRKRSCKRPCPLPVLVASMQRWLHCVREVLLKFDPAIVEGAAPAIADGAVPALLPLPDYDTDDEGPVCEPPALKRPRVAKTIRIEKSIMTTNQRVKRWEYGKIGPSLSYAPDVFFISVFKKFCLV